MTQASLRVEDLSIEFHHHRGNLQAIHKVSLELRSGEILGVVGESGAGKSLTGSAITGLLAPPGHIVGGDISYNGRSLLNMAYGERQKLRGKEIAAIFQDPLTSLNPVLTIGDQLVETIQTHLPIGKKEAHNRAVKILKDVGIPAAEQRMAHFPHQFSGGMRQRVVIALALCVDPKVVIADEPTTALDVSVQAQILKLLRDLCSRNQTAIMLVTHDMGVVAEVCDRVAVLYAGHLVESGDVKQILKNPRHPYTKGLMDSIPKIGVRQEKLFQIPGSMPRLNALPPGCKFNPRCPYATDTCLREVPPSETTHTGHIACWNPLDGGENDNA
ncbi:ABC transporter ATP-binding protein [Qingshengfaniella alkalisoli]|uniref:ABC transporter ATP-binding protein n=1 Tax=Qingshengfaniella alkalisoli TaxID=2599296 RepID=A0A5B8J8C5_9RHOB|nr:ABC transporter ATP-binding protein [Qingshengfaniella alkalisoli]QDY70510.1 ABC transporter ATP-binding protein [Qingshengfaniella alkalisoli]